MGMWEAYGVEIKKSTPSKRGHHLTDTHTSMMCVCAGREGPREKQAQAHTRERLHLFARRTGGNMAHGSFPWHWRASSAMAGDLRPRPYR